MINPKYESNSSSPDSNTCDGNCEEPTISEKAKGFFSELKKMAKRAMGPDDILCSKEIQAERLKICESCEFKVNSSKRIKCSKCGCYMEVKTWIASSKCPVDKWKEE
tara:strand:+ start:3294 stop:3614 length:321 start_codon:yes stop_codon:yes gene_type:complete